jgi:hypothetical protein
MMNTTTKGEFMYLHELYKFLGLRDSNYARWAKETLAEMEEGVDYEVQNLHGTKRKSYKLSTLATIIMLDKYSIDKEHILAVAQNTEDEIISHLVPVECSVEDFASEEYYTQFMRNINRYHRASKDIPEGYYMPSEIGVSLEHLIFAGIVDNSYKLQKLEPGILPRVIVSSRGCRTHVILTESKANEVRALGEYNKRLLIEEEKRNRATEPPKEHDVYDL